MLMALKERKENEEDLEIAFGANSCLSDNHIKI